MKATEFEFFIHKFDYTLPVYSDNKNLISEQRTQVLSCLTQLKVKMLDVITNLNITNNGMFSQDYDRCVHLAEYYNYALRVLRNKEMSDEAIRNRKHKAHSYSEAQKINSRFD